MDLDRIDKPEWLTDEEWAELKQQLRKGRFLAEIRPDVVALVRAGANRRPFYSAKTEDEMSKEKKAAGSALKMLMAYQQKLGDLVDKVKGMEADAELDEATVQAIGALGAEMAKMLDGYGAPGMDEKAKAEAEAKATEEAAAAKKEADERSAKMAAEAKTAAEAIADEKVKKALDVMTERFDALEKRHTDLLGKLETVEKSTTERKDELTILADLVEGIVNPTASSARA